MSDEPKGMLQTAADAVSFDRLVVAGLLGLVFIILILTFLVHLLPSADGQATQFVLSFFKDTALILVGALANSVRSHGQGGPDA